MEPTVSAATVKAIIAYASQRAIDLEVPDRDGRYPFSEVVALWQRAQRVTGDASIGRAAAALVPVGAFGLAEHVMLLSATLESAIHRLIRYYPTVNQAFVMSAARAREGLRLELQAADGAPILPAYADFVLASVRRRLEIATGRHRLDGVVHSAGPEPHLLVERDVLKMRLPFGDEELCELVELVGERRLPSNNGPTADAVSEVIAMLIRRGQPRLADVARRLNASSRSVQRRLIEEGTSFRVVLDDGRRKAALALVGQGVPLKQIADRLGFVEVRSFHRAFRRWTGTTPSKFRPH